MQLFDELDNCAAHEYIRACAAVTPPGSPLGIAPANDLTAAFLAACHAADGNLAKRFVIMDRNPRPGSPICSRSYEEAQHLSLSRVFILSPRHGPEIRDELLSRGIGSDLVHLVPMVLATTVRADLDSVIKVARFFAKAHASDVVQGGVPVLRRKLKVLRTLAPAVSLAVLAWLARPLLVIRLVSFYSSRIGHFADNTDIHFCERMAGLVPRNVIERYVYDETVANEQLARMWNRSLCVPRDSATYRRVFQLIPEPHRHFSRMEKALDTKGVRQCFGPFLSFTRSERETAARSLKDLGLEADVPFVTFHSRDPAYLRSAFPGGDWEYHSYRDASIESYLPAAQRLVALGYTCVRVGSCVERPLPTRAPRIIDYALHELRSDLLDVFLLAHCAFHLGCGAGIDCVARLFRRPVAFANVLPLGGFPFGFETELFIPKRLWSRDQRRFLRFHEMLDPGLAHAMFAHDYAAAGVEPVENTADEIEALAMEMHERVDGTWVPAPGDEPLLDSFYRIVKECCGVPRNPSRICAAFLRRHADLL